MLKQGSWLARAGPPGSYVHVLAAVPERLPPLGLGPEAQQMVAEMMAGIRQQEWISAENLTARVAERVFADGLTVDTRVREVRPAEVIREQGGALAADLIVIGAKGLSAPDQFRLGATAHKVIHYADCSVLVARASKRARLLSRTLATDGSPEAAQAAEFVCVLAQPRWAEATVVCVAETAEGLLSGLYPAEARSSLGSPEIVRRALLDASQALANEAGERLHDCGVYLRRSVRAGHPASEILLAAAEQDADLIVLGARGETRSGLSRVGAVAQKVAKYAIRSVLVVRQN